nr:DUF975 family protein [uncultured Oscillibacter sp.]
MMFEQVDRQKCKWETAELLRTAEVSPKSMTALFMALALALGLVSSLGGSGFVGIFISILATLLSTVLSAGFVLYCMAIRRGERAEYLTLFDGFSFVGKLILLELITAFFIFLWSLLFVIPGVIAAYRYSFALFNLYENPGIGAMEALDMSKRQTLGYKSQLFMLDLSYFGWMLLARLPSTLLTQQVARDLSAEILYGIPAPDTYFGLPLMALDLILGLWQLAVALFYYPNYICVQLAYFETAKRTSGVGQGAEPPRPDPWGGWNAPDGLG